MTNKHLIVLSHSNINGKYDGINRGNIFFFFFSRRYNPWWVLACFTISFHNLLSLQFSLQFLTFVSFKSSSTLSSHLNLGLPTCLDEHGSHSVNFLVISNPYGFPNKQIKGIFIFCRLIELQKQRQHHSEGNTIVTVYVNRPVFPNFFFSCLTIQASKR